MSILPLPVFEAEADLSQRGLTEEEILRLKSDKIPESIIVRYGYLNHLIEAEYNLDTVPRCGTRFVVRTPRGSEIGEMLTTTCANSGCSKSITREQVLAYLESSGSNKFPFTSKGKIIRLASAEDKVIIAEQEARKRQIAERASEIAKQLNLEMDIIQTEQILGGERLTFYFMSEDRVDFRDMVKILAKEYATRIEMRQVGARDEARLNADYERCGQQCCCRQFLKVLNPISMRSAKIQKATLDPLKISGRCGRLLCCLQYEDSTYQELRKNLPHKKTRVGTTSGPGLVVDTQIITQLVLVELEHDKSQIAVKVEELLNPDECPKPEIAANKYQNGNGNGYSKSKNSSDFNAENYTIDLPEIFQNRSRERNNTSQFDNNLEDSSYTDKLDENYIDNKNDVDEDDYYADDADNVAVDVYQNLQASSLTKDSDDEILIPGDLETSDKEIKRQKGKYKKYHKPRKPKPQSQAHVQDKSSGKVVKNKDAESSSSVTEIKTGGGADTDNTSTGNTSASENTSEGEITSSKSRRNRRNRKYKGKQPRNFRKQQPKNRPSQ